MEEETPQDLDEKRIDLSQFDAITPGNWEAIETPNGGIHIGVRLGENAHRHIITFTDSLAEQVKKIERDVADMNAIAAVPRLIAELKRCYEREDMIIRALKGVWIGDTCWHQPSEHLEDIAETRGSKLGYIASLLQVDVNQQDIHELEYGCGGENCDHNASE